MLSSSYQCLLLFLFPAVNVSFNDPELKAIICPAAKGTYVHVYEDNQHTELWTGYNDDTLYLQRF